MTLSGCGKTQNLFNLPAIFLFSVIFVLPAIGSSKVYIDIDAPAGVKLSLAVQEFIDASLPEDAGTSDAVKVLLRQTVVNDLDFSGFFVVMEKTAHLEEPKRFKETDFRLWRALGAEVLIKGSIKIKGDKLSAEFKLLDVIKETELLNRRYVGSVKNPRAIAHRFSDDIMEKLTGRRGIFSTKLAYVSDKTGSKEIYISDYDGQNTRAVTNNGSINISPHWSPDGRHITYTSYVNGHPSIYSFDTKTGAVKTISDRPGINLGGVWSRDFKRMALTMSGLKSPELFILEDNGYTQITDNRAIDVTPSWSPDSKRIVFTSDMAGKPHLYMINFDNGGRPERLTYEGSYNTQPSWSPHGKSIAFSRLDKEGFNIWLMNEDGGGAVRMTSDGNNSSPSWSPDGQYISFEREEKGRSSIYIMRKDAFGGGKNIDPDVGNETAPAWSPYMD